MDLSTLLWTTNQFNGLVHVSFYVSLSFDWSLCGVVVLVRPSWADLCLGLALLWCCCWWLHVSAAEVPVGTIVGSLWQSPFREDGVLDHGLSGWAALRFATPLFCSLQTVCVLWIVLTGAAHCFGCTPSVCPQFGVLAPWSLVAAAASPSRY